MTAREMTMGGPALGRVAKAIADEEARQLTDGTFNNELDGIAVARAALLAIRRPSRPAIMAADDVVDISRVIHINEGRDFYTAIIDHILNGGE